jgi:hypothetical protein
MFISVRCEVPANTCQSMTLTYRFRTCSQRIKSEARAQQSWLQYSEATHGSRRWNSAVSKSAFPACFPIGWLMRAPTPRAANKIGPAGATALAEVLAINSRITELELGCAAPHMHPGTKAWMRTHFTGDFPFCTHPPPLRLPPCHSCSSSAYPFLPRARFPRFSLPSTPHPLPPPILPSLPRSVSTRSTSERFHGDAGARRGRGGSCAHRAGGRYGRGGGAAHVRRARAPLPRR